ncbi:MAG: hypothetical protein NTU57_05010 [Candidatus Aenigmarchaeota archaeon]|nr:hypothetical protein [Candidatus Aenigmarchaeota archaeon]
MISIPEQRLMLRMGEKEKYNRVYNRSEIKDFEIYKNNTSLSRALTNLEKHLLIERLNIENPRRFYFGELFNQMSFGREETRRIDKELRKKGVYKIEKKLLAHPNDDKLLKELDELVKGIEFPEFKAERKLEDVVRERLKMISRMRKKFKDTPKRGRVRFRLTEFGMLFVVNLMEAEKENWTK